MKNLLKLFFITACALPVACSAADASNVKNWKCVSSGKMTVVENKATNSAEFTVNFSKKQKDRWAYPSLKLDKTDLGASKLTFDIKIKTVPTQTKYKNTIVMLHPADKKVKKIWRSYHLSNSDDFQTITIDLKKAPAYKGTVQIGLNFIKADSATVFIRNVKFIK